MGESQIFRVEHLLRIIPVVYLFARSSISGELGYLGTCVIYIITVLISCMILFFLLCSIICNRPFSH